MAGNNNSVAAVLVTFNRKVLLCECLDALLAQSVAVDRIVLIDNASSDGTADLLREKGYLENQIIDYLRLPANGGGAGGFHEGVKRAYDAGFTWLWLMDDDVAPMPRALEQMLLHQDVSQCLQACKVFDDGTSENWERWAFIGRSGRREASPEPPDRAVITAESGCFEGMLIHRNIVAKIGLPDKRFFLGADDVAYGYMASKHTRVVYLREPCFLKKMNKFGKARLLERIKDRFLHRRSYRFYFLCVRNEILLYGYTRDKVRAARFAVFVAKMLCTQSITALIFERSLTNFTGLWKGALQGCLLLCSHDRQFDLSSLQPAGKWWPKRQAHAAAEASIKAFG